MFSRELTRACCKTLRTSLRVARPLVLGRNDRDSKIKCTTRLNTHRQADNVTREPRVTTRNSSEIPQVERHVKVVTNHRTHYKDAWEMAAIQFRQNRSIIGFSSVSTVGYRAILQEHAPRQIAAISTCTLCFCKESRIQTLNQNNRCRTERGAPKETSQTARTATNPYMETAIQTIRCQV